MRDIGTQIQCWPRRVPDASACSWRASISAVLVGLLARRAETSGSVISQSSANAASGMARKASSTSVKPLRRRVVDFRMRDPYDKSCENSEGGVYQKLR